MNQVLTISPFRQNLGRIDTHDINLMDEKYSYSHAGLGVDVYVIDTYNLISRFSANHHQRLTFQPLFQWYPYNPRRVRRQSFVGYQLC